MNNTNNINSSFLLRSLSAKNANSHRRYHFQMDWQKNLIQKKNSKNEVKEQPQKKRKESVEMEKQQKTIEKEIGSPKMVSANSTTEFDFSGRKPIFSFIPQTKEETEIPKTTAPPPKDEVLEDVIFEENKDDICAVLKKLFGRVSPRAKELVEELIGEIEKSNAKRKEEIVKNLKKDPPKEQEVEKKSDDMEIEEETNETAKRKDNGKKSANKKRSIPRKVSFEFGFSHICDDVNEITLYLILRLVLNNNEWKKIEKTSDDCKFTQNDHKKISAAFFIASQIEDASNQGKQSERKKLFTLYLYFCGLKKAALRNLSKFGLTTTVHPRKIYSETLILSWLRKDLSPFKVFVEKGFFIIVFDNNYFKIKTPSVGEEINKYSKMKEKFPTLFSKYNFKTVSLELIFPPLEFVNKIPNFEKPTTDFVENSLWSQTQQQISSINNFLESFILEVNKKKSDLWFFKRIERGHGAIESKTITLQSCLSGDDSKNDVLKIVEHSNQEVKKIFEIDSTKSDFEFGCDAKGYLLFQNLLGIKKIHQKVTIGDLHFGVNLMKGFLAYFYNYGIEDCAKVMDITKNFKKCLDTEFKKVRKIICTISAAYLKYTFEYFTLQSKKSTEMNSENAAASSNKKLDNIDKFGEYFEFFWKLFEKRKGEFEVLSKNQAQEVVFDYKEKWKANYLAKTNDELKQEIEQRGLSKNGEETNPKLIAILVKDDFKQRNESIIFCKNTSQLQKEELLSLQVMCCLLEVSYSTNREQMVKVLSKSKVAFKIDSEEHYALSLFIVFTFSNLVYMYEAATKTKNWDLRIATMKKSKYLFELTNKDKFQQVAKLHLTDLKDIFKAQQYWLVRELWTTLGKTTETCTSLDDKIEFTNKALKQLLYQPSINNVKYISRNRTFFEHIEQSLNSFVGNTIDLMQTNRKQVDDTLNKNISNILALDRSKLLVPTNVLFNFEKF